MRQPWMVLICGLVFACNEVELAGTEAASPFSHGSVLMQLHTNFVPSTTTCGLYSFVAATPPQQPAVSATLCAIGGPFADGKAGAVVTTTLRIGGQTIQLDRTVSFSDTDSVYLRTIFRLVGQVTAGSGGLNYFSGTWEITGGTGDFVGLRGQGTLVNAVVSSENVPPPPQFADESLVGWVEQY